MVQRSLDDFGRRLYGALATGRPDSVVLDEADLRSLLNGDAADFTNTLCEPKCTVRPNRYVIGIATGRWGRVFRG